MFSVVDMENILRQHSNNVVYNTSAQPLYPIRPVGFQPDDFESDEFRMYTFKIKKCTLNKPHDWTICPYAHKGERARRRDPRRLPYYVAVSCPDYGISSCSCPRGDRCQFAHGVFEYWLHPMKYRTRVCKAGSHCIRSVCFFAHSLNELRLVEPLPCYRVQHANLRHGLSTTNYKPLSMSTTSGHESLGVIGYPISTTTTSTTRTSNTKSSSEMKENPKELKLEFLETLRMLRFSEYSSSNNNNNVVDLANLNSDVPNLEWVSDLLAE